jgi:hypothetical protein
MLIRRFLLVMVLWGLGAAAWAEPVVVVNAASAITKLGQDDVVNIFLGRYRRLPTGETAVPIDQPESTALRAEFYRKLVNKEPNEVSAYWSRLLFSGKTSPPLQAVTANDVAVLLMSQPGGIAYIDRSQVDKRFRIVMEFSR